MEEKTNINKGTQILLSLKYKELLSNKSSLPSFDEVGFKLFSQHNEDGILLYIFSLIGTTNKKAVEICAGNGIECNTSNLIVNHGWIGLLFDGSEENINKGKKFYSKCLTTKFYPPKLISSWIDADNVDSLIKDNGFEGEIDLLSLDIDGVDYYIWKSIKCINPRVIVLEYNHLWGPDKSVSVPYSSNFKAEFTKYGSDYAGASLSAFVKLGKEKGYRLVGCNIYGTNAFFIRNDVGKDILPEIKTNECFKHPRARFGMEKRLPKVKDKKWIEI